MDRHPLNSCARRFVIAAGGRTIADGVQFTSGAIVLASRSTTAPIEIYPGGLDELASTMRPSLHWIDGPRPETCRT